MCFVYPTSAYILKDFRGSLASIGLMNSSSEYERFTISYKFYSIYHCNQLHLHCNCATLLILNYSTAFCHDDFKSIQDATSIRRYFIQSAFNHIYSSEISLALIYIVILYCIHYILLHKNT